MQNSSKIQKPKFLSRSDLRRNRSKKILRSGRLSDIPCHRCCRRKLKCWIMENNRCSECVASGVENCCNAEGCVDTLLAEAEAELREVMKRMSVLLERVAELKLRSRKEYDDLMDGIEGETNGSESSSDPVDNNLEAESSSRPVMVDASVGTDPIPVNVLWSEIPIEGGLDFLGGTFE
jgi:hypothetical protein